MRARLVRHGPFTIDEYDIQVPADDLFPDFLTHHGYALTRDQAALPPVNQYIAVPR